MSDKKFNKPAIIATVLVVLAAVFFFVTGNKKDSVSGSGTPPDKVSDNPAPVQTFKSGGVTLQYPGDWRLSEDIPEGYTAVLFAPREPNDKFTENVMLRSLNVSADPDITLDKIVDLWLVQTPRDFTTGEFTLLDQQDTTLAGYPAVQFVYNASDAEMMGRGQSVLSLVGDTFYSFEYLAESDEKYDLFLDDASFIFSSFTIE